jgi:AraC-like DNA-binding protein
MSPFHFLRLFKSTLGMTPGKYVTEARIEMARELLARGSSVTEACLAVGFSSASSFSSAFRRRYGQSPQAFQKGVRAFGQVPARISAIRVPFCFVARYAPGSLLEPPVFLRPSVSSLP